MMQQWADMVDSTAPQNKLKKVKYFTARVQPSPSDPSVNVGQNAVDVDLEDYH